MMEYDHIDEIYELKEQRKQMLKVLYELKEQNKQMLEALKEIYRTLNDDYVFDAQMIAKECIKSMVAED